MSAKLVSVAIGSLDVYETAKFQTRSFQPTEPTAADDFLTFIKDNVHVTIDRFEGKNWRWLHTPIIMSVPQSLCIVENND